MAKCKKCIYKIEKKLFVFGIVIDTLVIDKHCEEHKQKGE